MLKNNDIEGVVKYRFPEAVALIITKNKTGKVDLCPVGFFTLASWEPKAWVISVYKTHYTTSVLKDTKEFVLCLPSFEQVEDVLYCGSVHGWKIDKTKNIKLKFIQSKHIKPPLIDNSIACFECKVAEEYDAMDHVLFLGEVVASYESNKNWKDKIYNWDDKKLGTLKLGGKSKKINYTETWLCLNLR